MSGELIRVHFVGRERTGCAQKANMCGGIHSLARRVAPLDKTHRCKFALKSAEPRTRVPAKLLVRRKIHGSVALQPENFLGSSTALPRLGHGAATDGL